MNVHPQATHGQRFMQLGQPMTPSPFMRFWKTTNDILRSRNLPEMLYGEARDWWKQHQDESWEG